MKHIFTLAVSALPSLTIAQCDSTIPSSATTISTNGSFDTFGNVWVCDGVTATFTASFVNAFIELNADVTASTNLGVYSVRGNSTLTISGFNNNIYYDNTATIVDNGTGTLFTLCEDLTFDYSGAPKGGCALDTKVSEVAERLTTVYPNPAHDMIHVQVRSGKIIRATLADLSGRTVSVDANTNGSFDLSKTSPGTYVLRIHTTVGMESHFVNVF